MDTDAESKGVIVVGVDGPESLDALRWAVAQAELTGSSVEAVTAWTAPTVWGRQPSTPPGWDPEEMARQMLAESVESVLGPEPGVPEPGVEVRQVVVEGHAAPVLIEAAKHAELLVVGSRGHHAFSGMLLGSVGLHCATHSPCPVVVVHPAES